MGWGDAKLLCFMVPFAAIRRRYAKMKNILKELLTFDRLSSIGIHYKKACLPDNFK